MRGATNKVRALQAAVGATLIGLLVCVAIISQAQLRRPVSLASKNAKVASQLLPSPPLLPLPPVADSLPWAAHRRLGEKQGEAMEGVDPSED